MSEISFLGLDRGYDPLKPPRSLQPAGEGGVWAQSNNVRFIDGYVRRRPSLRLLEDAPLSGNYPTTTPIYPTIINNVAGDNGDIENAQVPVAFYPAFISKESKGALIVVTSRQIHRLRNGVWGLLDPRYNTGTVTVSGTTVTGTGTEWQKHLIQPGNLFKTDIGGFPLEAIVSVDSETQLTLLNAPGDLVDQPYTIRRNFVQHGRNDEWANPVLSRIYNGDLYVAGTLLGAGSLTVFRVQAAYSSNPIGEYLVSTVDPTGTTDPLVVGENAVITGLDILDDGRVVISTNDEDNTSRVQFSAAGDQTDWTGINTGFTDLTTHQTPLRTIRRFGTGLACHFDDGVAVGQPTGQAAPPLNFQRTRATTGAISAASIHEMPGGAQCYISRDAHMHIFDGSTSNEIGASVRDVVAQWPLKALILHSFTSWNAHDQEMTFWLPAPHALVSSGETVNFRDECVALTYNVERDIWDRRHFQDWVGSVSDTMWGYNDIVDGRIPHGFGYAGVPSLIAGQVTNMIYKIRDAYEPDVNPAGNLDYPEEARRTEVESDDVMGRPGERLNVRRVSLVCRSETVAQEQVSVGVSYDGGSTFLEQTRELGLVFQEDRLYHFEDFAEQSDEKFRIRVRWAIDGDADMQLGQVHVEYNTIASDKAAPRFRLEDLEGIEFWAREAELRLAEGNTVIDYAWGVTERIVSSFTAPGAAARRVDDHTYLEVSAGIQGEMQTPSHFTLTDEFSVFCGLRVSSTTAGLRIAGPIADTLSGVRISSDGSVTFKTAAGEDTVAPASSVPEDVYVVVGVYRNNLSQLFCTVNGVDVTASGTPNNTGDFIIERVAGPTFSSTGLIAEVLIFSENHFDFGTGTSAQIAQPTNP